MIKRKFNWYLLILAICELIFCSILFIDYAFRFMNPGKLSLHDANIFLKIMIDFFVHTTDSFSCVITLLLSIDHMYAIRNPNKIRNFITNLHSKSLLMLIFVCLIILKMPGIFFCFQYERRAFFFTFCAFVSPILFNIIPTIAALIVNILLIIKIIYYVRSLSRKQNFILRIQTNNSLLINEKRLMRHRKNSRYFIIIFLSFWLVATTLPYYLVKTYFLFYRYNIFPKYFDFDRLDRQNMVIWQVSFSILFNTNHCINFIVYFYFYSNFSSVLFQNCLLAKMKKKITNLINVSI